MSFSKWAQAHPKNPNIWVALMLSGMGSSSVDVFRMAKAKVRMMKQKGSDQTESYWSNLWVVIEEEAKERARRAAAAS
ncbi:hypothetical protein ACSBR2_027320 [Camellia fascicularis]